MAQCLDYEGAAFALLTQHGKEVTIGARVAAVLRGTVQHVAGFDTDRLGTFTREVPRSGSQLDAAREKARLGISLSGLKLGLGSEGSFTPGPFGIGSHNVELVCLVDDSRGLEIVGRASAPAQHQGASVQSIEELIEFACVAAFPTHALVLRAARDESSTLFKGLQSWGALHDSFSLAQAASSSGVVFAENDLRAHLNPTRMANIVRATNDLLQRMCSACPRCAAPGFGVSRTRLGLPCGECGAPTQAPLADEWACVRCEHVEVRMRPVQWAAPQFCDRCNP